MTKGRGFDVNTLYTLDQDYGLNCSLSLGDYRLLNTIVSLKASGCGYPST